MKMTFATLLSTRTARKVPEVLLYFWIIKLLTTAMGESTSDYLVHTIDPKIAVVIGAVGFIGAILLQFRAKRYVAWIYWLTVTMIAIFGTMVADVIHLVLGIPYFISTITFAIALAIIFSLWYKTEHTLSIHSIYTPRRELFYWLTVATTFALGTALGDLTAISFHIGYFVSGILFLVLFIVPFIARKLLSVSEVVSFWAAYIVTRPLGASFADWFGRTKDLGGIGFGTGQTSILLTLLIVLFVGYLACTKKDIKDTAQNNSVK